MVVSWVREPAPEHRKPHAIFEHGERRTSRFRLRGLTHDGQLAEPVDVGQTADVAFRHAPSIAIHEDRLVAVWNHHGSTAELRA